MWCKTMHFEEKDRERYIYCRGTRGVDKYIGVGGCCLFGPALSTQRCVKQLLRAQMVSIETTAAHTKTAAQESDRAASGLCKRSMLQHARSRVRFWGRDYVCKFKLLSSFFKSTPRLKYTPLLSCSHQLGSSARQGGGKGIRRVACCDSHGEGSR